MNNSFEQKGNDLENKIEKIKAEVVKKLPGSEMFSQNFMYKIDEKYYVAAGWPMEDVEITDSKTPIITTTSGTPLIEVNPDDFKWEDCSGDASLIKCNMSDLFTEVKPEHVYDTFTDQHGNASFKLESPFVRINKKKEDIIGTRQRIQNRSKLPF